MTPTSNTNTEPRDPDELLQSIRSRNLIAVTGTGFSCLASGNPLIDGHPVATWPGLLEHGFQYCIENGLQGTGSTRDVRMQLDEKQTRQLIGAAQTILDWLGQGPSSHRQKWLNSSIGRLELKDRALVRALKLLSPRVLLTLNYDDLLEQGTNYPALDWTDHDLISSVLRHDAPPHVIHLHGYWKKAEHAIFDFFSYRDRIKDLAGRGMMHQLFIYRRLLFVGCRGTFEDPHFKQVMSDISQAGVSYTHNHYVLCRDSELDDMKRMLAATGMFQPLVYGDSYEDLTPFLGRLARNAGIELEDQALSSFAIGMPRQKAALGFKRANEVWRRQVND